MHLGIAAKRHVRRKPVLVALLLGPLSHKLLRGRGVRVPRAQHERRVVGFGAPKGARRAQARGRLDVVESVGDTRGCHANAVCDSDHWLGQSPR